MKNDASPNSDGWEPCVPGTLSKISKHSRLVDSDRRTFILAAGAGAILAVAGFRVYLAATELKPDSFADFLPCAEVKANMVAYVAKTIDDEQLVNKIGLHLKACYGCNKIYIEKMDGQSV